MKVIVIFWVNEENFVGVVRYDEGEERSVDEIVRAFERERGYKEGTCYGRVEEVAEVTAREE